MVWFELGDSHLESSMSVNEGHCLASVSLVWVITSLFLESRFSTPFESSSLICQFWNNNVVGQVQCFGFFWI
jgi:hypothetical protein